MINRPELRLHARHDVIPTTENVGGGSIQIIGFFITDPILTPLYKGFRVGPFSSARNARLWSKAMIGVLLRVGVVFERGVEFEVLFRFREDRSLDYEDIDIPY